MKLVDSLSTHSNKEEEVEMKDVHRTFYGTTVREGIGVQENKSLDYSTSENFNGNSSSQEIATLESEWFYVDANGQHQGPFPLLQMQAWLQNGHFHEFVEITPFKGGNCQRLGNVLSSIGREDERKNVKQEAAKIPGNPEDVQEWIYESQGKESKEVWGPFSLSQLQVLLANQKLPGDLAVQRVLENGGKEPPVLLKLALALVQLNKKTKCDTEAPVCGSTNLKTKKQQKWALPSKKKPPENAESFKTNTCTSDPFREAEKCFGKSESSGAAGSSSRHMKPFHAPLPVVDENVSQWQYEGADDSFKGPFPLSHLRQWFQEGSLHGSLPIFHMHALAAGPVPLSHIASPLSIVTQYDEASSALQWLQNELFNSIRVDLVKAILDPVVSKSLQKVQSRNEEVGGLGTAWRGKNVEEEEDLGILGQQMPRKLPKFRLKKVEEQEQRKPAKEEKETEEWNRELEASPQELIREYLDGPPGFNVKLMQKTAEQSEKIVSRIERKVRKNSEPSSRVTEAKPDPKTVYGQRNGLWEGKEKEGKHRNVDTVKISKEDKAEKKSRAVEMQQIKEKGGKKEKGKETTETIEIQMEEMANKEGEKSTAMQIGMEDEKKEGKEEIKSKAGEIKKEEMEEGGTETVEIQTEDRAEREEDKTVTGEIRKEGSPQLPPEESLERRTDSLKETTTVSGCTESLEEAEEEAVLAKQKGNTMKVVGMESLEEGNDEKKAALDPASLLEVKDEASTVDVLITDAKQNVRQRFGIAFGASEAVKEPGAGSVSVSGGSREEEQEEVLLYTETLAENSANDNSENERKCGAGPQEECQETRFETLFQLPLGGEEEKPPMEGEEGGHEGVPVHKKRSSPGAEETCVEASSNVEASDDLVDKTMEAISFVAKPEAEEEHREKDKISICVAENDAFGDDGAEGERQEEMGGQEKASEKLPCTVECDVGAAESLQELLRCERPLSPIVESFPVVKRSTGKKKTKEGAGKTWWHGLRTKEEVVQALLSRILMDDIWVHVEVTQMQPGRIPKLLLVSKFGDKVTSLKAAHIVEKSAQQRLKSHLQSLNTHLDMHLKTQSQCAKSTPQGGKDGGEEERKNESNKPKKLRKLLEISEESDSKVLELWSAVPGNVEELSSVKRLKSLRELTDCGLLSQNVEKGLNGKKEMRGRIKRKGRKEAGKRKGKKRRKEREEASSCSRTFVSGWQWRQEAKEKRMHSLELLEEERLWDPQLEDAPGSGVSRGLQLARNHRALHRQLAVATEGSDSLKLSLLKTRKKRLKFERSRIHGWGLLAVDAIEPEEFIIEYTGEIIRRPISEMREKRYEKMGLGSSYLFRIDDELVIDATIRGGQARFINHSCEPNCFTKIISAEGRKHVVIYSKRLILPGEELTYDYKFPREDEKVPCYCGAQRCRGTMN